MPRDWRLSSVRTKGKPWSHGLPAPALGVLIDVKRPSVLQCGNGRIYVKADVPRTWVDWKFDQLVGGHLQYE
jgi:hypothetical protein